MEEAKHTQFRSSRRVSQTAAHQRVISVRPRSVMPHAEWSVWFERRALMNGYTAVIDGTVIEPGTQEASAVINKLSEVHQHFSDIDAFKSAASH